MNVDILVVAFFLKEFGRVLGVFYRTQFEAVTEIGGRGRLLQTAAAVLPGAVGVLFAPKNHVVPAGRAHAQVVKSGEERHRVQLVTGVGRKQVPGPAVVALLVVGDAFFGVVAVIQNFPVGVVRVDVDSGSKQELVGKVTIQE